MEAVPFFGLDATDDWVVLPFFRDGFAAGDGDEETIFGALFVDGVWDRAGGFPLFSFMKDVLEC